MFPGPPQANLWIRHCQIPEHRKQVCTVMFGLFQNPRWWPKRSLVLYWCGEWGDGILLHSPLWWVRNTAPFHCVVSTEYYSVPLCFENGLLHFADINSDIPKPFDDLTFDDVKLPTQWIQGKVANLEHGFTSLHNLMWTCYLNEYIRLRHRLRFPNEVD